MTKNECSAMKEYSVPLNDGFQSGLAAPRCKPGSQDHSWTAPNPASYLIDSGLWTACNESRERIKKRLHTGPRYKQDDIPATGIFTSAGEVQVFTTCPKTGLFCFQAFNPETTDWLQIYRSVPIMNPHKGHRVTHAAVEYDRDWIATCHRTSEYLIEMFDSEPLEKSRGTLGFAARVAIGDEFPFQGPERLWFIDKRIERRIDCPLNTTIDRHVFCGNGWKYVEVREDDEGWIAAGDGRDGDEQEIDCPFYYVNFVDRTVFGFLGILHEGLIRYFETVFSQKYGSFGSMGGPEPGVLACVED